MEEKKVVKVEQFKEKLNEKELGRFDELKKKVEAALPSIIE